MPKPIMYLTSRNRRPLSKLSAPWIPNRRSVYSLAPESRFLSSVRGRAPHEKPKSHCVPIPPHHSRSHMQQIRFLSKDIRRSLGSSMYDDGEEQSERTIKIRGNGKMLSISHEEVIVDGNFHAAWLWANDPAYCHPSSGQRTRSLGEYDANTCTIASAEIVVVESNDKYDFPPSPPGSLHPRGGIYKTSHPRGDHKERLKVVWKSGEISYYDLNWLARFNSSGAGSKNSGGRVTKDVAIGAIHEDGAGVSIPKFEYDDIMKGDDESSTTLFSVLGNIMIHGAVLVQNAPAATDATSDDEDPNEAIVANLGRRICNSQLSHGSLYGDVFHVISMPNAHNIAYTTEALAPHQDLTYYESKPFLQLLHCVQNATLDENDKSKGRGESILIDAMAAAEELRRLAPDLFETLCLVEATFCKQREGADMVSAKPHIVVSPFDQSVIEINWSPPFEGPLLLPPTMSVEGQERLMDDYTIAYQAMSCLLDNHTQSSGSLLPPQLERELKEYAQRYTWEYALKEGEILVFNNQRMLHGRRSFSLQNDSKKHRHLIGCYTDAMDTLNHFRLLLRKSDRNTNILTGWRSGIGSEVQNLDPRSCTNRIHGEKIPNPGNGSRTIQLE